MVEDHRHLLQMRGLFDGSKTRDDAIKIMAAKVGADPVEYASNVPGTHFLTVAEAKAALKKSSDHAVHLRFDGIDGQVQSRQRASIKYRKAVGYLSACVIKGLK